MCLAKISIWYDPAWWGHRRTKGNWKRRAYWGGRTGAWGAGSYTLGPLRLDLKVVKNVR